MKLAYLKDSILNDCKVIIKTLQYDLRSADKGKTGIKPMYFLLDKISHDRAYDDNHPLFKNGAWKRILPYDGREFCFYYKDNANDNHLATLLKQVQYELLKEV